jgi:phospholipid/cholesterol/gamma-HCH transport system substrate-binding protein
MNRGRVFAQLVIFASISIAVIAYALFGVIGVSVLDRPYSITVQLATGGGIFTGSDVTYRGVHAGRVTSVRLNPNGVTVTASIDHGRHIPANAIAQVHALSVVGEQYLDFVPTAAAGPYLHGGSVVPLSRTRTPIQTAQLMLDLEQWLTSLNTKDVTTVSDELANAFGGVGPQLREVIVDGTVLADELARAQPATLDLLSNSRTLLDTAVAHTGDFRTFATSLLALSQTLKSSTPAESQLVTQAPANTALVGQLIKDNAASAAVLLSNLATFSRIQSANVPAFRALLAAVPQTGRLVPLVVRDGAIQSGALFNYDQPVCSYGIALGSPLNPARSAVKSVSCTNPVAGELVRGAANTPSPTPDTGLVVTQSGQVEQLGWNGGQSSVMGANSWQSLMLSGTGN